MATKIYNYHLSKLIQSNKENYILDTYIALVHLSSEVNSKFIIQTYSNKVSDLVLFVNKQLDVCRKTVYNCINKLIEHNYIIFDQSINAWTITDMEYMVKKKDTSLDLSEEERKKYSGFTYIRQYFLTKDFSKLKLVAKKFLLHTAQLEDSIANKHYKCHSMDLNNSKSGWFKSINIKSKYYLRKTLLKLNNMGIIQIVDEMKDFIPEKISRFRIKFTSDVLKKSTKDDNCDFDIVQLLHPTEYLLIKDALKFFEENEGIIVTLSKKEQMHLIRAIVNVKNFSLKERVVRIIINKYVANQHYKSSSKIKSLPAYAAAVVKSVIDEFKNLFESINSAYMDNDEIDYDNYEPTVNLNIPLFS